MSLDKKYYAGHRERLREKFRQSRSSLTDAEVLELFLFFLIPYKDTKPLAKELLQRFSTFDELFMASEILLQDVSGIGKNSALALNVVGEIFVRRSKQNFKKKSILNSWEAVISYCQIAAGYQDQESVHVLFLNKRFHLIADEILFSGTIDETPFHVREIIKRALVLNAVSLIIVHNHPSGNPSPSKSDILQTQTLFEAAKTFDINVYDHIIVAKGQYTSLKAMGVLT